MKEEKTNAIRTLTQKKIPHTVKSYLGEGTLSGKEVADYFGEDPGRVFKTLVTVGKSGKNYVFVVPCAKELDLKKAAAAVGEKSVEMIRSKDLLPLTGYVHGGCSPIGMKKYFRTVFDSSAADYETVMFSGGKIGLQIEMSVANLEKVISVEYCPITC